MNRFTGIHTHEYGSTVYHYESARSLDAELTVMEDDEQAKFIRDVLLVDFEPERGETFELHQLDFEEIQYIA